MLRGDAKRPGFIPTQSVGTSMMENPPKSPFVKVGLKGIGLFISRVCRTGLQELKGIGRLPFYFSPISQFHKPWRFFI